MHIIIAGCGRIGNTVIKEFCDEEHDVVIIDSDSKRIDALGSGINAKKIVGVEYDVDILKEAGIEDADVFLALTGNDSVNITACQIASVKFNVKKVMAKVSDLSKEHIYKSLNIDYVNPIKLGVEELKSRI